MTRVGPQPDLSHDPDPAASTADGDRGRGAWQDREVRKSLEQATRRSLDRSHAFVKATIDQMRQSGDAFTVQDICDRAGYSQRLFYQYFDGKNDLLIAVLEELLASAVADYRSALAEIDGPLERLAAYIILSVTPARDPLTVALSRYVVELSRTTPELLADAHRPHVELIHELLDDSVEAGVIEPGDRGSHTYFILSLRAAYNHSLLLGNELGLPMPSPDGLAQFLIRALGGTWTPSM